MTNELKTIPEILELRRYNPETKPPPEEVLFTIGSSVIGTASNYVVMSGSPKAGKSTYLSAAIGSAFMRNDDVFGIKLNPPKDRPVVGYFDTESSQYDIYRTMERIKKFSLKSRISDDLNVFSVREDSPKRIRALVNHYLEITPLCSILVIDGFLDLVLNYNDEVETRKLVNWFKQITKQYNILLIGVLHLSKGQGETLGHLGSNTDRWAQSTLVVEKDKLSNTITLKPKFLRSAADFNPISLYLHQDGNYFQVPYEAPAPPMLNNKKKRPE
jgi:hypothetical protein